MYIQVETIDQYFISYRSAHKIWSNIYVVAQFKCSMIVVKYSQLINTVISRKVVGKKRKSARDNPER